MSTSQEIREFGFFTDLKQDTFLRLQIRSFTGDRRLCRASGS